jgi:predicted ribosomally synthesized peptide with SipW-like signal peptide
MSGNATAARSKTTRGKVFALLSGGLILGLGATATLASWNDEEWVNGGVNGTTSGVGTSTFNVQQNRGSGWGDFATPPGGTLTFTAPTSGLTPGDAAYTQVSLRTTLASVAGNLDLLGGATAPTPAFRATDAALWNALQLRVVVTTGAAGTCDLNSFTAGATYVVGSFAAGATMASAGSVTRGLSAAGANQQNYCFQLLLPTGSSSTLMGLGVSPMWEFSATSI